MANYISATRNTNVLVNYWRGCSLALYFVNYFLATELILFHKILLSLQNQLNENMKTTDLISCFVIAVLWLVTVALVLLSQPFTFRIGFILIASGIIVFVPLYKKHFRKKDENQSAGRKDK